MGELIHSPVYTQEQVTTGLLVLAANGGNCNTASEELHDTHQLEISRETLRRWKTTKYPELYRELHDTHRQHIEPALVAKHRDLAIRSAEVALQAVDLAEHQILKGELKDAAGAARNLTVTSGTAMDKVYLATDRPTEIRLHQSPSDILQRLTEALNTTDTTAIEEPTPSDHGPFLGAGASVNAQE